MRYIHFKYFLPFWKLSLCSCWLFPLLYRSFLVLCNSICYLCFCLLCFWHLVQKVLAIPMSWSISLFSFNSFIVSGLTFNPFWINFYDWYNIGVQLHSSACGYQSFPIPFIEKTIPSPIWKDIDQVSVDYRCVGLVLSSLFCSIGLCVSSYANTMHYLITVLWGLFGEWEKIYKLFIGQKINIQNI
jgi:hypothetical protein